MPHSHPRCDPCHPHQVHGGGQTLPPSGCRPLVSLHTPYRGSGQEGTNCNHSSCWVAVNVSVTAVTAGSAITVGAVMMMIAITAVDGFPGSSETRGSVVAQFSYTRCNTGVTHTSLLAQTAKCKPLCTCNRAAQPINQPCNQQAICNNNMITI